MPCTYRGIGRLRDISSGVLERHLTFINRAAAVSLCAHGPPSNPLLRVVEHKVVVAHGRVTNNEQVATAANSQAILSRGRCEWAASKQIVLAAHIEIGSLEVERKRPASDERGNATCTDELTTYTDELTTRRAPRKALVRVADATGRNRLGHLSDRRTCCSIAPRTERATCQRTSPCRGRRVDVAGGEEHWCLTA